MKEENGRGTQNNGLALVEELFMFMERAASGGHELRREHNVRRENKRREGVSRPDNYLASKTNYHFSNAACHSIHLVHRGSLTTAKVFMFTILKQEKSVLLHSFLLVIKPYN